MVLALGLVLWSFTAWLDWSTGLGLRLGPLYVIPAALVAWTYRWLAGLIAAVLLIATWQLVEHGQLDSAAPAWTHLWNLLVRTSTLVSVAAASAWARSALERQKRLASELQEALKKVQVLEGLLPICAWCKRVRNDRGEWEQVERYVSRHSHATWSHGICPDCQKRLQEASEGEAPE